MRIAFVGKAGSGKSLLAQYLVTEYGFKRMSFANKMKDFAAQILMRPIDKRTPKIREFLQVLGTDAARMVDKDIWIKHLTVDLVRELDAGVNVVIDDCRFLNEAEFLHSFGFLVIRVVGRQRPLSPNAIIHPSEVELEQISCDTTLDNSGSVEGSIRQINSLIVTYARMSDKVLVLKAKRGPF